MHKLNVLILFGSASFILQGCDTVRSTLGLDHYQADAFSVPTNPPLTLPPDYNLKPPTPGAGPAYAQTSDTQAQKTLNTSNAQAYSDNKLEGGLIGKVSTYSTPPTNIRELVDKEAEQESTLPGKLGKQIDDWKKQAKDNFYSISDDKKEEKPQDSPPQKLR